MTEATTRLLFGFLIMAGAYVSGVQTFLLTSFLTVPAIVTKVEVENSPVMYGENVIVTNTYDRRKLCKMDLDRFIIREGDELLVRRERVPSGTTDVGVHSRRIAIPTVIPGGYPKDNLSPGHTYKILTFIHSDCGDRTHTSAGPIAYFTVKPFTMPP